MKKSLHFAPVAAALALLAAPASASDRLQAHAGENGVVETARQCSVFVAGTASSSSQAPLKYRWREGKVVLSAWKEVRADRTAPLDLCGLSVGSHALTLEVKEGKRVATSSMTATVVATPAVVATTAEP